MDSPSVSQRHCSSCMHAIRASIHSQLPLFLLLHTKTHKCTFFLSLSLTHTHICRPAKGARLCTPRISMHRTQLPILSALCPSAVLFFYIGIIKKRKNTLKHSIRRRKAPTFLRRSSYFLRIPVIAQKCEPLFTELTQRLPSFRKYNRMMYHLGLNPSSVY